MNLSKLLLGVLCTHLSINGYCQKITISRENAVLMDLFKDIREQTGYDFFYRNVVIDSSIRKTIKIKDTPLRKALKICLEGTYFDFKLSDDFITIEPVISTLKRDPDKVASVSQVIHGKVSDQMGKPLESVTVRVLGTSYFNITNLKGEFNIPKPREDVVLEFSCVGFQKKLAGCREQENYLAVTLKYAIKSLDETVVIAYGTSSSRLFTGNAFKVSGNDISKQPVSNPLEALAGRVPGLTVTPANGMPSANLNLQIRGQSSLAQGTQPLYIIDGIPVLFDLGNIGQVAYFNNQNPFNTINPADIESIEVLKDANATAIYGSQGANGVVLINTKKGKMGRARLDINTSYGISKLGKTMPLLNRKQYLAMRREAFKNDGTVPGVPDAPDLLLWDTTRDTDWKKELVGGSASTGNIQASVSGGTIVCQYFMSGNFYRTTTVFPNDKPFNKTTIRSNLNLASADKKIKAYFAASYGSDFRRFPGRDLTNFIFLPPHAPAMSYSNGQLDWSSLPYNIDNPYSSTLKEYSGQNSNLAGNAVLQYSPADALTFKVNLGYEQLNNEEHFKDPIRSQRPAANTVGSLTYGDSKYKSWVIEPQALYQLKIRSGLLNILAGISWQKRENTGLLIKGTDYKDDDLLGNIAAAPTLSSSNYARIYKYNAVFGKVSYNLLNRYMIDLNIRTDGSSRFGPAGRFSTFGAAGAAWIFTEEPWFSKSSFLSFGKVRASAGITGNDQIGDYSFYDLWSVNPNGEYDSITGILADQLFNPKLRWERNIKREIGLSLGCINDKYVLSVSYYRNTSNNQLINYTMPSQTGFTSLLRNLDAEILNNGLEFEINLRHSDTKNFSWSTAANLTIPRNKLLRYPGLQQSSDAYKYKIGEPLSVQFGFGYRGIDPITGSYIFQDIDENGAISIPKDLQVIGNREEKFYGGVQNTFRVKHLELDFLLQFIKQTGYDWFTSMQNQPGQMWNQPDIVLDRWQKQYDQASVQAWSDVSNTAQSKAFANLQRSTASLVDASFLKLKSAMITYVFSLPAGSKISKLKIFVQGQNLITLTGYKGLDPEIQSITVLPLLRTVVGGVRVVF